MLLAGEDLFANTFAINYTRCILYYVFILFFKHASFLTEKETKSFVSEQENAYAFSNHRYAGKRLWHLDDDDADNQPPQSEPITRGVEHWVVSVAYLK